MREKNFYIFVINSIVVALFIILVVAQAGKKFVLDEIDFPIVAHATSQTGVPIYYRGEENSNHIGLYHPPLYIYTLAGFVKTFGYSENTVRMFGALCALITAFLSLMVAAKLFPNKIGKQYFPLIFLPLFLIHPYTLANATLPDIDSTILPVVMLLFIYYLVKNLPSQKNQTNAIIEKEELPNLAVLMLSLIFALNLWAKMTTTLVLIPIAFFILLALGYALLKSIVIVTLIATLGTILFLSSYWTYCYYYDLPFSYTFQFLVHSFTKGTSSPDGLSLILEKISTNFSHLKQFANWITLPFIFAFFLSLASFTFKKNKSKSEYIVVILSLSGILVSIFYLSLIAPFGGFFKYPYPIFPFLVFPIALFLASFLFNNQSERVKIIKQNRLLTILNQSAFQATLFVSIFLPFSLYQLLLAKDLAILSSHPKSFHLLSSMIAIAILIGALSNQAFLYKILKSLAPGILAILLGTQIGISRSQAVAEYPTKYEYGKMGMNETVAYLKASVESTEIIWSMKDVGYYVNNKYIENYGDIFDPSLESKIIDAINLKNVRYFVVTQQIGQDRVDAYPTLKHSLDSCCIIEQEFGNFVIYKVKSQ